MAQNPSIGRIVHFGTDCDAALVVHVWTPEMVNLAVFDHNGKTIESHTSTPRDDKPRANAWHWPERVE